MWISFFFFYCGQKCWSDCIWVGVSCKGTKLSSVYPLQECWRKKIKKNEEVYYQYKIWSVSPLKTKYDTWKQPEHTICNIMKTRKK